MPPAISAMDSQIRKRKVSLHFSDIDRSEPLPDRIITLEYPEWSAAIGRGSSTDDSVAPKPGNAWYTSKVMSRHHAEVKAIPESRIVTVKDLGSMHGTFLNGEKVTSSPETLLQDDILTFGTRVIRGEDAFDPLKTSVSFQWTEDVAPAATSPAGRKNMSSNSFTADYSDVEEIYSDYDDEVEIVRESIRQPSVELLQAGIVRPITSSATTSPYAESERRTSSITAPTDTSSILEDPANEPKVNHMSSADVIWCDDDEVHSISNDSRDDQSEIGSIDYSDEDFSNGYVSEEEEMPESDHEDMQDLPPSRQPATYPEPASMLSVPDDKPAREPSPSDAAMAKPRPASPPRSTSAAPSLPFTTSPAPPPPGFIPDSYLSSQASRPYARNAIDPRPPVPYSTQYCTYNAPGQYFPAFPTISSNGPFGYNLTHYDNFYNPVQPSQSVYQSPPQPTEGRSYAPQMYQPTLAALSSSQPPADFVRPSSSDGFLFGERPTLKRKADQISEDEGLDSVEDHDDMSSLASLHQSPVIRSTTPAWGPGSSEIGIDVLGPVEQVASTDEPVTTVSQATKDLIKETEQLVQEAEVVGKCVVMSKDDAKRMIEDFELSAESAQTVQQPPRKKAKVSESRLDRSSSTAKTAMKYAAVALAGASAGAVGTVYALANLPLDYFVSTA